MVLGLIIKTVQIEADFEVHYPDATMKLFTEWITLSSFILEKVSLVEKDSVEDCFTSGSTQSLSES